MKKLILTLLIIHCSLIIANAQWVQMSNGMGTNKTVWSLAVSGNNIFAGTNSGVYLSTNNGEFWTQTSLTNQSGNVILIKGNNIYVGTNNGIYLSTNNGQNWIPLGINNRSVWALASKDSNVFAGTVNYHGLYRSTNNGINWTQTSLNNVNISSIVISGNNIFAGDWMTPTVFLSTDNGFNWIYTYLGEQYPRVVLSLVVKGDYIFAGTDNDGIFYTTNNGFNWVKTSLYNRSINCFSVNDNYIFAGTFLPGGVYLSSDNGTSWKLKNEGLGNLVWIWSLLTTSQYIFAGSDSSVWRRDISEIIGIQNISTKVPSSFSLYQNYPNPFNPSTKIKFDISGHKVGQTFLSVYDITGREIQTLVNEKLNPGTYEVTFDGSNYASGVYFYQLRSGEFVNTKKLILLK